MGLVAALDVAAQSRVQGTSGGGVLSATAVRTQGGKARARTESQGNLCRLSGSALVSVVCAEDSWTARNMGWTERGRTSVVVAEGNL